MRWEQQKAPTARTAKACLSYFIGFEVLSTAGPSTAETPWSGILGHSARVQAHSLRMVRHQNLYYRSNCRRPVNTHVSICMLFYVSSKHYWEHRLQQNLAKSPK